MMRCLKLMFVLLILSTSVYGFDPYHAKITVDTTSATVGEPNILNLVQELKSTAIEKLIPIYTPTSAASFKFNLRGIKATASFAANSTAFNVQFPQLGFNQTFTGSTREDSLKLFEEFVKEDAANSHKNFFQKHAELTPIDPIAGNPNSLMNQMAQSSYLMGRLSPLSGCDPCWNAQPILNRVQIGLYAGRAFCHPFDTTMFELPLQYSYSPDGYWAYIIDAPLTLLVNDGAYSIFGSLGFGWRIPVTANWSLTPIFRVGTGESIDLSTGGAFVSPGITSNYNYKWSDYVFSITNFIGYNASTPLHWGGVNFDYHLYNTIYKNGITVASCRGFKICRRPINVNLTFVDTAFTGSDLFINHFDEVGIGLFVTGVNPCVDYDCLSLSFTYQFGKESYHGYYINLGYQF